MKLLNKIIVGFIFLNPAFSQASLVNFGGFWVRSDVQIALQRSFEALLKRDQPYKTPKKVKPLQVETLKFESPQKRLIRAQSENLDPTPARADAKKHRRAQIDRAKTEEEKAAARWRRKCRERGTYPTQTQAAEYEKWLGQYERIRNNGGTGRAAEEHALREFNVESNNMGETTLFEDEPQEGATPKRRRPDGLAMDEAGDHIVVEIKHKRPGAVLYATQQIRTEENAARELDGRHVVILSLTEDGEFPRVSRGFRDLITEFRLIAGEDVYRLNQDTRVWDLVE